MILTKQINTDKATILVIGGLPEDVDKVENPRQGSLYYYAGVIMDQMDIPPGNWQPLGFLKDIQEDVAKELVEETQDYDPCAQPYSIPAYRGYIDRIWKWRATESLQSLIEVNCGEFTNPYLLKKID